MATASRSPSSAPVSVGHGPEGDDSALLLDVTGRRTSAAVIDRVDGGRHRFVVSSSRWQTSGEHDDIVTRLRDAIEATETRSGGRLLESNRLISPERKDGSGCDAAVLTVSLPLTIAVVGATSSPLRSRLDAVLATSAVSRVPGFDPAAKRSAGKSLFAECVALVERQPDLLIVVPDPPARRGKAQTSIGQYLSVALEHVAVEHPIVLGLGPKSLTDPLSGLLSRFADFRSADLDSTGGTESLRLELLAIWRDTLDRRYAGCGFVQTWLRVPPMPTADGFAIALRYLASKRQRGVWGIDLGPQATTVVRASAEQSSFSVSGNGSANATQWLWQRDAADSTPANSADERRRDLVWNQLAHQTACPVTSDELDAAAYVARRAIASTLRSSPLSSHSPASHSPKGSLELLVLRGEAARTAAHSAEAVAALASEIRRSGVFEVAIDRNGIVPCLGALAAVQPLTAVEALLADGTDTLGTVAIGSGRAGSGAGSATAELRSRDGLQTCEVGTDSARSLPLAPGETADLTITPTKGFDFGRGAGKAVSLQVVGGTLGIVLLATTESKPAARASRG